MAIPPKKPKLILSFIAYVVLATLVAYLVIESHPEKLAVGTRAPIETSITTLFGTKSTFKKLVKKPTVINFFATWCPPCIKEMPVLSKLAKKYQGQITFIGAATDSRFKDIVQLKKEFSLDYELGIVDEQAIAKWQAQAIPLTYIVDKNGIILWAFAGILEERNLEGAIESILSKKTFP